MQHDVEQLKVDAPTWTTTEMPVEIPIIPICDIDECSHSPMTSSV